MEPKYLPRIQRLHLAIYVLIQSLDELHQDVLQFTPSEHSAITTYVTGDDIMVQIDVILQTRPNVVNFVCGKSYLGIWLKKLFAEWSQLSAQQIFDFNAKFVEWIQAGDSQIDDSQSMDDTEPPEIPLPVAQTVVVPFEIESSGRARKWISNQMHLLQVCPSAALPDNEIMDWCHIIRKNHADIVEVVSIG
ncbi:hypothetical protein OESDEN_06889 [Oesophagostomum dentatum]|uniref:Uncharacterized protein n=1 Tax=Oesophagostomum dentatum TaxID=61180 RepID=A0A0B1TBL5_OESDE|nr:hypothetical protein OESDEN_06889 [Oesophagostomum dentatum]